MASAGVSDLDRTCRRTLARQDVAAPFAVGVGHAFVPRCLVEELDAGVIRPREVTRRPPEPQHAQTRRARHV
eukprot:3873687-Pyramimonas_sp.AAC.1